MKATSKRHTAAAAAPRLAVAYRYTVEVRYPCEATRVERHRSPLATGQVVPRHPVCEHPEACPPGAATKHWFWWCSATVVSVAEVEEATTR